MSNTDPAALPAPREGMTGMRNLTREERKEFDAACWADAEEVEIVSKAELSRLRALAGDGALQQAATESADAIDGLFAPAHLDGCLWRRDKRMPCQCGALERENAAVDRARKSARQLRATLTPERQR